MNKCTVARPRENGIVIKFQKSYYSAIESRPRWINHWHLGVFSKIAFKPRTKWKREPQLNATCTNIIKKNTTTHSDTEWQGMQFMK